MTAEAAGGNKQVPAVEAEMELIPQGAEGGVLPAGAEAAGSCLPLRGDAPRGERAPATCCGSGCGFWRPSVWGCRGLMPAGGLWLAFGGSKGCQVFSSRVQQGEQGIHAIQDRLSNLEMSNTMEY